MEARVIDTGSRQFAPDVAVGSPEFMRFLMGIEDVLADGVSSWRSTRVERRLGSDIEGQGLFATTDIEPHELLAVKGGRVINEAELRRLTEAGILHGSQQQIELDLFLVGLTEEEEDRNLIGYNHSCSPNAMFAWDQNNRGPYGTCFLIAKQAIAAGQEITTDYSVSHVSNTHRLICNCQSPDCRVVVQPRYDYLHPEFQEKHRGEFPRYIQELIDDLASKPQEQKDAILFSAFFGETVGTISMLDEEVKRLSAIENPDQSTTLRIAKFEQLILLNTAFLVGTYPGVAKECGIDMSNLENFQKSVTKRQSRIIEFAKAEDEKVGWLKTD